MYTTTTTTTTPTPTITTTTTTTTTTNNNNNNNNNNDNKQMPSLFILNTVSIALNSYMLSTKQSVPCIANCFEKIMSKGAILQVD
ncbi:unnamed protein product [Schistosoma curassoni]|uniref:Uncharacterized protein n=1 Tax=Schistosoma curassoni TaxID=6186 RepID=A0A183JEL4_9TREM|nr:unnamed protein product [Schistosoma curassoni]